MTVAVALHPATIVDSTFTRSGGERRRGERRGGEEKRSDFAEASERASGKSASQRGPPCNPRQGRAVERARGRIACEILLLLLCPCAALRVLTVSCGGGGRLDEAVRPVLSLLLSARPPQRSGDGRSSGGEVCGLGTVSGCRPRTHSGAEH